MAFQASNPGQYEGQGGWVPELDFPIIMLDLRSDPDGGRGMEYELYSRLSGLSGLQRNKFDLGN